jgi:hypothetical protein
MSKTDSPKWRLRARWTRGVEDSDIMFGRVTVLLGANGSGKSWALRVVRDFQNGSFGRPRPAVYVEGGRAVAIPSTLQPSVGNMHEHGSFDTALNQHRQKRTQGLRQRLDHALFALQLKTSIEKIAHSDAAHAWVESGSKGRPPERPEPPLDKLFRLHGRVFPLLQLELTSNLELRVTKGKSTYNVSDMSDGEKQVLAIFADLVLMAEPSSVIIVDEPELNLNPLLASAVWSEVESELPEAVFAYATHSISFAMRPSVASVVVLSPTRNPTNISTPLDLPAHELRPFLGAIPAILASEKALLVEGVESSVDPLFYPWVMEGLGFTVSAVGSCQDVLSATARERAWSGLASDVVLRGVIDRDYRSEEQIASLVGSSCLVLDLHEAESYLCVPELLSELCGKLGLVASCPPLSSFRQAIIAHATRESLHIAAQRTFAAATQTMSISLKRKAVATATTAAEMVELIRKECERVLARAQSFAGADAVANIFDLEHRRVQKAIAGSNIEELLRLCPGKELLASLAHEIGCEDASAVARAARVHLKATDFEPTRKLRKAIAG